MGDTVEFNNGSDLGSTKTLEDMLEEVMDEADAELLQRSEEETGWQIVNFGCKQEVSQSKVSEATARCERTCGLGGDLTDVEDEDDLTRAQMREQRNRMNQEVRKEASKSKRQQQGFHNRVRGSTRPKPISKHLTVGKPMKQTLLMAKNIAKAKESRSCERITQKRRATSSCFPRSAR
jgi:hypothetical protein